MDGWFTYRTRSTKSESSEGEGTESERFEAAAAQGRNAAFNAALIEMEQDPDKEVNPAAKMPGGGELSEQGLRMATQVAAETVVRMKEEEKKKADEQAAMPRDRLGSTEVPGGCRDKTSKFDTSRLPTISRGSSAMEVTQWLSLIHI